MSPVVTWFSSPLNVPVRAQYSLLPLAPLLPLLFLSYLLLLLCLLFLSCLFSSSCLSVCLSVSLKSLLRHGLSLFHSHPSTNKPLAFILLCVELRPVCLGVYLDRVHQKVLTCLSFLFIIQGGIISASIMEVYPGSCVLEVWSQDGSVEVYQPSSSEALWDVSGWVESHTQQWQGNSLWDSG